VRRPVPSQSSVEPQNESSETTSNPCRATVHVAGQDALQSMSESVNADVNWECPLSLHLLRHRAVGKEQAGFLSLIQWLIRAMRMGFFHSAGGIAC